MELNKRLDCYIKEIVSREIASIRGASYETIPLMFNPNIDLTRRM
jgi:hypothetical protein